jgi:hypothetical protein
VLLLVLVVLVVRRGGCGRSSRHSTTGQPPNKQTHKESEAK